MKKLFFTILFLSFLSGEVGNAQNAQEIFLNNLSVFEKLQKGESFDLDTIYDAREFLINITGIKYQVEEPFAMLIFPPDVTINEWRNWFSQNKDKLYWNMEKKIVEVNEKK